MDFFGGNIIIVDVGIGSALIQACEAAGATIPRCDCVYIIQYTLPSDVYTSGSAIMTGGPALYSSIV